MERNKNLKWQLDFLKGSEIGKEGLGGPDVLEPTTPNTPPAGNEAAVHEESELHNRKLQEKIERSMDAVKEFIRNIDISKL
ncbi:hypothetical protein SAMN02746041_01470 [Desulfacinum hydrothermale DSM 13146]|uniref:Uncharacterized protein n=1 Tax=Desulfacinum hydrothermale DSM 13146 TaxID=1121390 RepID=A0A1W1XEX3_9BACT|nr:hypothetical protein [Desulfacinum hydrothermale]SMC22456.1 hypothetical protein SAMN02746041_01470 [Desulfacinum hydrothermale DSM 13146]